MPPLGGLMAARVGVTLALALAAGLGSCGVGIYTCACGPGWHAVKKGTGHAKGNSNETGSAGSSKGGGTGSAGPSKGGSNPFGKSRKKQGLTRNKVVYSL